VRQSLGLVPAVVPPGSGATSWTDVVAAAAALLAAIAGALAALAAVGTLLVTGLAVAAALLAAWYARKQVEEARALRREQAQPYVVVYADLNPARSWLVDVVVRNLGATGAHDVRTTSSPALTRTDRDGPESVALPVLPFLAPGQEWRTLWDSVVDRHESDLPDRYELLTAYRDSSGALLLATPSVLDWSPYRQRTWTEQRTAHDAAESARDIARTLGKLARGQGVVHVAAYDGLERDARRAEQRAQHQQLIEKYEARQAAETEDGTP
jgi:hypothetical protein